ncbi:glucan endo-1-3-beta-glucosidase [Apiospora marii]|uniref:glucan endo-1-3-beta-glucosidase n=1 Tax=Apiospora marii TaxID=335849 RepID=UPI0031302EFD
MTNPTTEIALKNNTQSSNVHAYITGLDINRDNHVLLIQSDGKTVYHPDSPSEPQAALAANCAIPLGAPGSTTNVTIPQIAGGRIWFAVDGELKFTVNPGPALVEPAVNNLADPNYNTNWGFCEFTFNKDQLFVNISYVDFVSLPVALELRNEQGKVQSVGGLNQGGLDAICKGLEAQHAKDGKGWDKLVVKGPNGQNLRALSPNAGNVIAPGLFDGYYQPYVDQVWDKYSKEELTINTQAAAGDVRGKVVNGKLDFGDAGVYDKPTAQDIFTCSTGPFATDQNQAKLAVIPRLAAAFNRSTLLTNSNQPLGEKVANYYKNDITNHYSRVVHENNINARGYAFPYDDVAPGDGEDQAGTVFDGAPQLLTVTLGGGGSGVVPPTNGQKQKAPSAPNGNKKNGKPADQKPKGGEEKKKNGLWQKVKGTMGKVTQKIMCK